MITPVAQRWADLRGSYRPQAEVIRTADYEVVELPSDTLARDFVLRHHYSGSYPAARRRYGLMHRRLGLVGVAVFSVPFRAAVAKAFEGLLAPEAIDEQTCELGRLVLLNHVPGNGESFFVGACFARLRAEGFAGVLSMSDPVARLDAEGRVIMPGHIGGIYQALNAAFLGRGTARTLRLLPDGTVMSARALQKIRAKERGWVYAVELLVKAGAPEPDDELRSWLREWLPRVTRPLPHAGNFKYAWLLHRGQHARHLRQRSLPYPKVDLSQLDTLEGGSHADQTRE